MYSLQRSLGVSLIFIALVLCGCRGKHDQPAAAEKTEAKPGVKETPQPKQPDQPPLKLSTDGVLLVDPARGTANLLAFGSEQVETTRQVNAAIGKFTGQARNAECSAGPLTSFDYPGGLTLFFQDAKFAGWDFDGQGRFATPNDIGIGSALSELRATGEIDLQDSSIGHEFSVGGLHGLVDATTAKGKVTNLWAGTVCAAR